MRGYVQVYRNLNKKLREAKCCKGSLKWQSQLGNGIDPKVVGDQPVYSVRGSDGLVKKHLCHFVLHDCTFRVSDKGNERVRGEKRKNVHAYIQGREAWNEEEQRWEYIGPDCNYVNDPNTVTITYDPYKYKTFVRMDTGKPVYKAKVVVFGCGKMGREVKAIL
jgi:hypothetical protein